MIIYINSDFKCHVSDSDGLTPIETDFFDGKCETYIEGYRFVPNGETWTRSDGKVLRGGMIAPWKPWHELDAAQRQYEREQLAAMKQENEELISDLAAMVDVVYENDLEVINHA